MAGSSTAYFEVGKRLREYLVPIYVVEGDDVEVLREIFDRTNSTGKRLTRDEVFDALVGSKVVRGEHAGLELVNVALADLAFGRLEASTIHKAFEAIRGDRIGKSDPRQLDPIVAAEDLERTAAALRRAVEILQAAGIPHEAVLPYELPLVVLARFLAAHARPDERSRVLLRRWLWRGILSERFTGASASLQLHVDDVRESDEVGSVERLLLRTGTKARVDLSALATEPFSLATARGKAVACALLAQVPRSLVDGEKLVPHLLFDGDGSRAHRTIVDGSSSALGRSLSNRLFHPATGIAPRRLIAQCTDEGALASHGIDATARDALQRGDANAFLERRAATLTPMLSNFMRSKAEWERDDVPGLVALIAASALR